ncbi:MAG: phosphoribosylformylglycinamidine cyclo-ligase [candidate division Zixibacteria bacterium]|nr:phosphoribosylformylglycinamidine cyclo-ligase [candidate division Zixibacteria bacterium]
MRKIIDYKKAGVDINKADLAKNRIKKLVRSTFDSGVLTDIGSFGGFYALTQRKYKNPVLVSSTDSVGTKLKIAFQMKKHDTIGEDIVNHCVNDILVHGAKPLFFLDYIGIGKLYPEVIQEIIKGLVRGCKKNNCSLIGGEMAQLPEFYKPDEYDLVGFVVGVVERKKIIDGSKIVPGDILLGLGSNGLHTNGYTLARKVLFEIGKYKVNDYVKELKNSTGKELIKVHRSYVKSIFKVLERYQLKGMAHITGGGIQGNLIRILPEGCQAIIDVSSWSIPPVFSFVQRTGSIETEEMFRVFNMGIGLILVMSKRDADRIEKELKKSGEKVYWIGEIVSGRKDVKLINF